MSPRSDETDELGVVSLPRIVGIGQLLEIAPVVKSEPLVGLAHRNLMDSSDAELRAHIRAMFEACWDEGLNESEALSLLCGSNVGTACRFRKLTPIILWERFGRTSFEARLRSRPAPVAERIPVPTPQWWGSRFETWSASVAPELPTSFRSAVAWALLSTLLGEHVGTPVGSPRLVVGIAGESSRAREDASRLGGPVSLPIDSRASALLSHSSERLLAVESDSVASMGALRERQGPPDHTSDSTLLRLISEALDGLERAQALGGPGLIVRSSSEALELVTALRTELASQLRTLDPDIVDGAVSGSALLVRRMAALAAVTEGETVVHHLHQLIAIDAARPSIDSFVRYLNTGTWIDGQERVSRLRA